MPAQVRQGAAAACTRSRSSRIAADGRRRVSGCAPGSRAVGLQDVRGDREIGLRAAEFAPPGGIVVEMYSNSSRVLRPRHAFMKFGAGERRRFVAAAHVRQVTAGAASPVGRASRGRLLGGEDARSVRLLCRQTIVEAENDAAHRKHRERREC